MKVLRQRITIRIDDELLQQIDALRQDILAEPRLKFEAAGRWGRVNRSGLVRAVLVQGLRSLQGRHAVRLRWKSVDEV